MHVARLKFLRQLAREVIPSRQACVQDRCITARAIPQHIPCDLSFAQIVRVSLRSNRAVLAGRVWDRGWIRSCEVGSIPRSKQSRLFERYAHVGEIEPHCQSAFRTAHGGWRRNGGKRTLAWKAVCDRVCCSGRVSLADPVRCAPRKRRALHSRQGGARGSISAASSTRLAMGIDDHSCRADAPRGPATNSMEGPSHLKSSRAIFFCSLAYQLSRSAMQAEGRGAKQCDSPIVWFSFSGAFQVSHPRLHPALESSPLSGKSVFFQRIGSQRRNATCVDADACCGCVATFGECHVRFLSTFPRWRRLKTESSSDD